MRYFSSLSALAEWRLAQQGIVMSATSHAKPEPSNGALPGPMAELFERIRDAKADDLSLGEALEMVETFVSSASDIVKTDHLAVTSELKELSTHLARARTEISALQPNTIKNARLPEAEKELLAVVDHTEEAAGAIMESAEAIMEADPSDPDAYQALVTQHVGSIFEACSFQDITGQRITKVTKTLNYIEERISRLIEAMQIDDGDFMTDEERADAERAEENFLHGPELPDNAHDQSEVDEIFSQDDIDALFD